MKSDKSIEIGKWVKYKEGSDYKKLWLSLQNSKPSCISWFKWSEDDCKKQMASGDVYLYYILEENLIPRIIIKTNKQHKITNISGLGVYGNVEYKLIPILETKLKSFTKEAKEVYSDMEMLSKIYHKYLHKENLNILELVFLYEIEHPIIEYGLGYINNLSHDPRIDEIRNSRNNIEDLNLIFEYWNENIKGNVDLRWLKNNNGLILPRKLKGKLFLSINDLKEIIVPDNIEYYIIITNIGIYTSTALNIKINKNLVKKLN